MYVLRKSTRASTAFWMFLSCCLVALLATNTPQAQAEKPEPGYIFVLSKVELPAEAPVGLESLLRSQMAVAIARAPHLEATLPADAPPYDVKEKGRFGNKAFHKYMKSHNLRAFHVTVQVTQYDPTLVPNDKKPGKILGSAVTLRMFGETIPDRVMAFSGDGSAAVLAEVGKTVRDRDREWVDSDAVDLALKKAVAMSLAKLEVKPRKPSKRKKRRSTKKSS